MQEFSPARNVVFLFVWWSSLRNCVAEGVREPRHPKTRFRSPSNSTAVPNLNCSLVFFFNSFSLYFFEKSTKNMGSCVRHSVLPLLTNCISIRCCNILRSVRTSSVAACRNAWGGKNSLRSNIMPPVSNHCSAARCASQRCPPALGGESPFAMNRCVE